MNKNLLAYLHAQRQPGRTLALLAADKSVVDAVASGPSGAVGVARAATGQLQPVGCGQVGGHPEAVRRRLYLRRERQSDVPSAAAKGAIAVTSDDNLASDAANLVPLEAQNPTAWRRCRRSGGKALRPHQWAKNLFIFVPNFIGWPACHHSHAARPALGLLIFNLLASASYIFVNDLLDLNSDERHTTKHHRPFSRTDLDASQCAA